MLKILKAEMKSRGISRNKLALLARIAPSDIYGVFNGTRPLFPAWRRRIADALGMDEDELFPEQEGGKGNEKV